MRIPGAYIFVAFLAGCANAGSGFTERETGIINSRPEGAVMRLFMSDNESDLPVLRGKADNMDQSVITTPEYNKLLAGMLATVRDPENSGVGIAAPQVGISKRIIAVQRFDIEGEPFRFYLNPRITSASDEMVESMEGCLSVADSRGYVIRHSAIVLEYDDPRDLTLKTENIEGFTAIIFQHEIDHLDGILFTDKTVDREPNYP